MISIETAWQEGQKGDLSMQERFDQLLVHGILHLLGYDHENTKSEARKMKKKEQELLNIIQANP